MPPKSLPRRGLNLALSFLILSSPYLAAKVAYAQSANQNGTTVPQNMDLSSSNASITAKNGSPQNIQVAGSISGGTVSGGSLMTVSPGQLVTPAQYMAVLGAMQGKQTLQVNSMGAASGGTVTITPSNVQNLNSLVVPSGVSVNAIGFNSAQALNISGNLNVIGSMFALQNVAKLMAVLNLNNLTVGSGALLSGSLPAGTDMPGVFSSSGMQLNLSGNLHNSGTISSPGTLNIVAAGGSGSFSNAGLIQAAGNINVSTIEPSRDLLINNTGGIIQSLVAAINFRDGDVNMESANLSVTGGRLDAPGGINTFGKIINVNVDSINGAISSTGSIAHVAVNSGNLVLGPQILSGDPTYYNNAGDITIADLTTVAGDLAIVASGNIITTGGTKISTTASNKSIFLSAGFNFTVAPSDKSSTGFPAEDPGDTANTLTFDGTSNSSKSINTAGNALNLSTTGLGDITLIATGSIDLGSGKISVKSGEVLIVAKEGISNTGAAGSISISGSNKLTIRAAIPTVPNGGTILNGLANFVPGSGSGTSSPISLPAITAPGSTVLISSKNGSITGSTINGNNSSGTGGYIDIQAGTGDISVGALTANAADGNTSGGVFVKGGNIHIKGSLSATAGVGGAGGNIFVISKDLQIDGAIDASAGSTAGLVIVDVSSSTPLKINTGTAGAQTIMGSVSGGSPVTITNTTSGVILDGSTDAVTGTDVTITSADSITAAGPSKGRVNSPDLTLKATSNIGTDDTNAIFTTSNKLTTTGTSVYINNTGNLSLTASGASSSLSLKNAGNVTLAAALNCGNVSVTLDSGSTFNNSGKGIVSPFVVITADDMVLSGASTIDAGGGFVQLQTATSTRPIVLSGTSPGSLSLSEAVLNSITTGTLYIAADKGAITVPNNLTITQPYDLLIVGNSAFDSTGKTITISGGGDLGIALGTGNISVSTITNTADKGQVSLQTDVIGSLITLSAGAPTAHVLQIRAQNGNIIGLPASITAPRDSKGNGGAIFLSAEKLSNIALDVSGLPGGDGGNVNYELFGTAAFAPTAANLTVNISGENAGDFSLYTRGNLTFNPAAGILTATTKNNGPEIALGAGTNGTGNLLVTGPLSADGVGTGNGGSIQLESSSKTAFAIGGSGTNAIKGALSVAGAGGGKNGDISVYNNIGGITDTVQALTSVRSLEFGANGPITIGKPIGDANTETISISTEQTGAISTGSNVLQTNPATGSVFLSTEKGAIKATVLTRNLSVESGQNESGSAASATITGKGSHEMRLDDVAVAGALTIKHEGSLLTASPISAVSNITLSWATGNLALNGNLKAGGNIKLTTAGTGNILDVKAGGSDFIQGKTVTLSSNGGQFGSTTVQAKALRVNTNSLALNTTGLVNIDNVTGTGGSTLTITAAKTNGQTFTVHSDNSVKISPALSGPSSVLIDTSFGAGSITVGSIGNPTGTSDIALVSNSGNISSTGTLSANTTVIVTTSSGNIGKATAPLKMNTPLVDVQPTNGLINISNTRNTGTNIVSALSANGALTFSSSSATNFTGNLSGSSVTVKTVGATDFAGNISATSGAVKVTHSGTGNITGAPDMDAATSLALTSVGEVTLGDLTSNNGDLKVSTKGTSVFENVNAFGGFAAKITQTGGTLLTLGNGGLSTGGSSFTLTSSGVVGIILNDSINAGSAITIKNTSKGANISLGGDVKVFDNTVGKITLTAPGTGTIEHMKAGADSIQASTLTLTADSLGSPLTPLRIRAVNLSTSPVTSATLNNLGLSAKSLTFKVGSSTGSFVLNSPSGVTIVPSLAKATDISISTAGTAALTVNGALGNTTTTTAVNLTTVGGSISGNGTISTNGVGTVTLNTTSGSYGSAKALKLNTPTLVASASTTGQINLSNARTAGITVNSALTSGGSLSFSSTGPVAFTGAVGGSVVSLKTVGTTSFANTVTASLGSLSLTQTGSGTATFSDNVSAFGNVTLTTAGDTSFAANKSVTANNGSLTVTQAKGMMTIGDSATLSALSVSTAPARITLLEKTNAAGSGITIGNKASLQAIDSNPKGGTTFPMPGQISVVVGASVPGSPVRGTAPGNVTVTEGASPFQVYWGKNQIDTSTGNPNVITIQGSTAIVFSAGTMAPIKLNGETDFFADPPVGPAIAAGVSNRTPASVSSNTGSLVQAAAINQSNRAATSVASPSIGSLLTMTLPAVPTQTIMRSQEWTSLRSRQDGSAPRPRQSFIAREDSKYEAEDLDPDEVIVDTGDSE